MAPSAHARMTRAQIAEPGSLAPVPMQEVQKETVPSIRSSG